MLYIIGNGFDRWHNLPTSYDFFYVFAKDVLNELEEFFSIDTIQSGPWSDFENSLGRFNWNLLYEAQDYTDGTAENFRPSEAFGLVDDITEKADALVNDIKECFHDWIADIDVSLASKKTSFSGADCFLTFNYTSTLQLVYGIDDTNIVHLHGRSDAYDELIFGHGESREEESELDKNGDSNRTMFSDAEGAAKYPFYAFQKPVIKTIDKNRGFFRSLGGVLTINVIGHSLNEVDLPYFEEVARNAKGAKWIVYCYTLEDEDHYIRQLLKCGIDSRNVAVFTYEELKML